MKATEQLKQEHESVKAVVKIMEAVSTKLESGQQVKPEHLEMLVDFIKVFTDKCHHGKEEGLLFPAMVEAGIPRDGGPIGVMLSEHDVGRAYVKGMSEGIAEYKKSGAKAVPKLIKNARGYADLLTQHIYKEDNILYPMADRHLSEAMQEELLEQFEKLEEEVIGAGRHEQLNDNLNILKKSYLK